MIPRGALARSVSCNGSLAAGTLEGEGHRCWRGGGINRRANACALGEGLSCHEVPILTPSLLGALCYVDLEVALPYDSKKVI